MLNFKNQFDGILLLFFDFQNRTLTFSGNELSLKISMPWRTEKCEFLMFCFSQTHRYCYVDNTTNSLNHRNLALSMQIIMKSLDPLRAKKTFIRKKLGHTAVSATKASSVTLKSGERSQRKILYIYKF